MIGDLSGEVAVVVGGTSGIGRVLAHGLAEAGADVVPTSRRMAHVESTAREIEERGRRTLRIDSDVCDRDSLEKLLNKTVDAFGKVDILVNCAGRIQVAPTLEFSDDEDFVSAATPALLAQYAAAWLRARNDPIEAMLMMRPYRRSIMCRPKTWQARKVPSRLISRMAFQSCPRAVPSSNFLFRSVTNTPGMIAFTQTPYCRHSSARNSHCVHLWGASESLKSSRVRLCIWRQVL